MRTRYTTSNEPNVVVKQTFAVYNYFCRNRLLAILLFVLCIWLVVIFNFTLRNRVDPIEDGFQEEQNFLEGANNGLPFGGKGFSKDKRSAEQRFMDLLSPDLTDDQKQEIVKMIQDSGKDINSMLGGPLRPNIADIGKPMLDSVSKQISRKSEEEEDEVTSSSHDKKTDISIDSDSKPRDAESLDKMISDATKVVITYGQNCCTSAKKRMCDTALNAGKADECHAYDASVMDADFKSKNEHILKQGRGAGYWLWKPYIIYKHLTDPELAEGSYITYSDAGAKLVGDVAHVLKFMEENDDTYKGVLFFGVGFDQKNFCKRDAFVLQDCDREECYRAMQINAFVGFFRKCEYSRMVVKTWLDACQDERILTDKPNTQGLPNLPGFRDHRHDQAVITNVMLANGWKYDTTNGPVLDKVFYHDRFKG